MKDFFHLSAKDIFLHQLTPQDYSFDLNPMFQLGPPDISCSHPHISPYAGTQPTPSAGPKMFWVPLL